MWEYISYMLVAVIILILDFFVYAIETSDEKINIEKQSQNEIRTRVEYLYNYLDTLKKSSTLYVDDPTVFEIYRKCADLVDYFDYIYDKRDLEKENKIAELIDEIEKISGKKLKVFDSTSESIKVAI